MRFIQRRQATLSLRALALGGAATALVLAFAGAASAQSAPATGVSTLPQTKEEEPQDASQVEDIVGTGTSIRGIRPVGSATVPLTREDIQQTGLTSTADVVR